MGNKIIHKKSAVADKTPTTSQLDLGELAINTRDKKIFFKSNDGTNDEIQEIQPTQEINKIQSTNSINEHTNATIIGSNSVKTAANYTITGGFSSSTTPSSANRKFEIDVAAGSITLASTLSSSSTFADFAEYFENNTGEEIPLGMLVVVDGKGVRVAKEGEGVTGVTSQTAGIRMNDTPLHWQNKFLTGEFGELLMQTNKYAKYIYEGKTIIELFDNNKNYSEETQFFELEQPIENPEFDESLTNIPRSKRPTEWTLVGLIGQVYCRVTQHVNAGDYIKTTTTPGHGGKATNKTNLRCLKITSEFDTSKGYAVALCLLK